MVTLDEKYDNQKYDLKVKDIYDYSGSLTVFMPIDSYRTEFDEDDDYFTGFMSDEEVEGIDEKYIDETTSLIENYVENTIGISSDYFSVSSQDSMLSTMDNITNTFSLLLGGIASISLIVGGIGVMNVMLVSVTERTKEIGIRKALGAKRKDILFQFLVESLVLCLIGGLIGVIFGISLGYLLEKMGYSFIPTVTIIIISFLSSALIGIIFGVFPANKASKLNPIEALRNE